MPQAPGNGKSGSARTIQEDDPLTRAAAGFIVCSSSRSSATRTERSRIERTRLNETPTTVRSTLPDATSKILIDSVPSTHDKHSQSKGWNALDSVSMTHAVC